MVRRVISGAGPPPGSCSVMAGAAAAALVVLAMMAELRRGTCAVDARAVAMRDTNRGDGNVDDNDDDDDDAAAAAAATMRGPRSMNGGAG